MFCKNCGYHLDDHALFCMNCGTKANEDSNNNAQETPNSTSNVNENIDTAQAGNQFNFGQPNPNNYTQPQQGSNPNRNNNYPQGPSGPRRNTQTTVIIAIIAILVVAGLVFGAIKLFSGNSSSSPASGVSTTKTKTLKDILIGTWDGYEVDADTARDTIKFQKDNTCTIAEDSDTYEGTYTIDDSDKNNIKINFDLTDSDGDSNTLTVHIKKVNDDKLKLIREDDVNEEDPLTLVRRK